MNGKLWGKDWMREGIWQERPMLAHDWHFCTTDGRLITVPFVKRILDAPTYFEMTDEAGNKYWVEVADS